MELRKECVICKSPKLENIYTLAHYPLCRHSRLSIENDKYADLEFGKCCQCDCVQLLTLQDPELIYSQHNNQTYLTPFWKKHHSEFSTFILNAKQEGLVSVVEVGGTTGLLAREILSKKKVSYNIVDLCNKPPEIEGVTFENIAGEQHNYSNNETVVMSHVFEHLYNPRAFLSKLYEAKVKDIFISIPDMESLLNKKVLLLVNVEHTFFCDISYCVALFSSEGYSLIEVKNFSGHSIFFHFQRSEKREIAYEGLQGKGSQVADYFKYIEKTYSLFYLDDSFYIAPSGYYGQMMYYLMRHLQGKVVGVLDNDIEKRGMRLYGTNLLIEHPSSLKQKEGPIHIVLSESFYSDEIKQGFLNHNQNIVFKYV